MSLQKKTTVRFTEITIDSIVIFWTTLYMRCWCWHYFTLL